MVMQGRIITQNMAIQGRIIKVWNDCTIKTFHNRYLGVKGGAVTRGRSWRMGW